MSKLSFVALSLQTTHLDPASLSTVAFVKLVDGNITRQDVIPIIPPTQPHANHATPSDDGSMTWDAALDQLALMVGKLPIVSYYRDADKEIFQAASRTVGAEPPAFHWLDCRQLVRTVLPQLPDMQLSTVLFELDLYEDCADSSIVEQTTQIVLALARRHGANTAEHLWGDLYEQPDDPLGLDTAFEGQAAADAAQDADKIAAAPHAAAVLPVVGETGPPHDGAEIGTVRMAVSPPGEDLAPQDEQDDTEDNAEQRADPGQTTETRQAPAVPGAEHPQLDPKDQVDELRDENAAASTADRDPTRQAAQPADIDTPVQDETITSTPDHDLTARNPKLQGAQADLEHPGTEQQTIFEEASAQAAQHNASGPEQVAAPFKQSVRLAEDRDSAEDSSPEAEDSSPEGAAAPEFLQAVVADENSLERQEELKRDADLEPEAQTTAATPSLAQIDPAFPEATPQPAAASPATDVAHASSSRFGTATTQRTSGIQVFDVAERGKFVQERRGTSQRKRMFNFLGIFFFGLISVVGMVFVAMAVMLFFTDTALMVETKIAGLILMVAVTLLSLLMTHYSYQHFRKTSSKVSR